MVVALLWCAALRWEGRSLRSMVCEWCVALLLLLLLRMLRVLSRQLPVKGALWGGLRGRGCP